MKAFPFVLVLLLLLPAAGLAQSLENAVLRNSFAPVGAGARAAGMGGAFLAIADDGTAASFNPAGLAQLRKSELAFVGYDDLLESSMDLSGGAYPLQSASARHSVPQFLGFAKPIQAGSRRLTVQLSYERTVDLYGKGRAAALLDAGEAPGLGPLGYLVDLKSEQEGAMHTITAAAGLEVTSRLMFGASTSYWIGDWRASGAEDSIVLSREPGVTLAGTKILFRQDHAFRGLNLNLGSLWHTSRLSVGGVLRLPFAGRYSVQERNEVSEPIVDPSASSTGASGFPEVISTATTEWDLGMRTILHWPLSAGIGVAVRPFRGLTLAADGAWTQWDTTIVENVPNGALLTQGVTDDFGDVVSGVFYHDRNFFDLFPASESLTGGTGNFRLGGEYLVNLPKVVVPIRVGRAWEESPVPELGRLGARRIGTVTVGFGLSFRRVALDIAYEHRTSSGGVGTVLGARDTFGVEFPTEDVTEDRTITSLIFRF